MTWFRIDDGFYDHPKVKALPRGAVRKGAVSLWTLAGSWCSRYKTDGLIPAHQIEEFGSASKDADALVAAVLWHSPGHDCETCPDVPHGHYLYHQWPEHQPLKADVEKRQAKARERMRKLRNGEHKDDAPSADVHDLFARTDDERAQ